MTINYTENVKKKHRLRQCQIILISAIVCPILSSYHRRKRGIHFFMDKLIVIKQTNMLICWLVWKKCDKTSDKRDKAIK